jgi:hypothetical protein
MGDNLDGGIYISAKAHLTAWRLLGDYFTHSPF